MAAPAAKPQELQIAEQFCNAYAGALASGNAAQAAGLYGPDSVASYDGTTVTGQAAIQSTFIAPRLAGGPVNVRFSSIDAQLTPTQQLLIVCTGESSRPAGRFTQVFLLNSIPTGGMYVRAEVARFGAAAAVPQNVAGDKTGMGMAIGQQYYSLYTSNKAGLQGLYRPTSQLTFETKPTATGAAIAQHLAELLPPGSHTMTSIDALQIAEAPTGPGNSILATVLLLVTGSFRIEGENNALPFAQTFFLAGEQSGAYCSNEVLRFNYA